MSEDDISRSPNPHGALDGIQTIGCASIVLGPLTAATATPPGPGVATGTATDHASAQGPFGLSIPFTTTSVEEASACIGRVYTSHRLTTNSPEDLNFAHQYAESSRLTIGQLSYGTDMTVDLDANTETYHVNLPVNGQCFVQQGRERVVIEAGRGGLLSPSQPLSLRWHADSVQQIVKVPRQSLERHLSRLINRPVNVSPKFALAIDLTSGPAQSLQASVAFLWSELSRPHGIATISLAREQLEQSILTQLLFATDHEFSNLLAADSSTARPNRIKKVLDYIDAFPGEDLTTARLAEVEGVTARALQSGFQKSVGMSPSAYVRGVRLERVHAELLLGAGRGGVTDIASRWGFFHLSRFADQYRQRFGVLPSVTGAINRDRAAAA